MTVSFELIGQEFLALNGGSDFWKTRRSTFQVVCDDQDEVDSLLGNPTPQGASKARAELAEGQVRWRSWQGLPQRAAAAAPGPRCREGSALMAAMMNMKKIVVADLEAAAA